MFKLIKARSSEVLTLAFLFASFCLVQITESLTKFRTELLITFQLSATAFSWLSYICFMHRDVHAHMHTDQMDYSGSDHENGPNAPGSCSC